MTDPRAGRMRRRLGAAALLGAVVLLSLLSVSGAGRASSAAPASGPHALGTREAGTHGPGGLGVVLPSSTAPRPTSEPVGQVGYTWDLTNSTVYPRAITPPLHWEPSAMATDPASGLLWVAWGPNPFGLQDNITVVNETTDVAVAEIPGTFNATGLLYAPAPNLLFVTQTTDTGGLGQLLILNATNGARVAPPVVLGNRPAAMAYDPASSLLFVASNGSNVVSAIRAPSGAMVDPFIPVGDSPSAAVYDPTSGDVYVTNFASANISVLNGTTGAPVGPAVTFPGCEEPFQISVDPASGDLLVVFLSDLSGRGVVGLIDPTLNQAVESAEVYAGSPASAEFDPGSGLLVLPIRSGSASLGLVTYNPVLDSFTSHWTVTPGPVGAYPSAEAIDAADGVDFVAHAFDPAHAGPTYLTTVQLTGNFSGGPVVILGASARGGTFDPDTGLTWVANSFSSALFGSEPDTVVGFEANGGPVRTTVPVGYGGVGLSAGWAPQSVGYDPLTHELVVVDGGPFGSNALLLNATTGAEVRTLSLPNLGEGSGGTYPNDSAAGASEVLFDPVHARLYFADPLGGVEGVYAGNLTPFLTIYDTLPPPAEVGWVHAYPYAPLALDPTNGWLFSVDPGGAGGFCGAFCTYDPFATGPNSTGGTVLGSLGTGVGSAAVYDPLDDAVYVTDPFANVVYVLNVSSPLAPTNVETIPVGVAPEAVAFDPLTSSVIVANTGSANLTILNGTTVAAGRVGATSLVVAPGPSALIVDPAQHTVLVSSTLAGTVQVVSPVPLLYSLSESRPSTDVGVPVTLGAVVTDGAGSYGYAYAGLPPGCPSADVDPIVCTPTAPGNFSIVLTVSDQSPFNATGAFALAVHPDPSVVLSETAAAVDVGRPFGASAVPTNGTAPLTVLWTFGDGGSPANGTTADHVYAAAGTYPVVVTVTDALGVTNRTSTLVRVGDPLGSSVDGATAGRVGVPSTWNGTALAGVAPYTFVWTFGDGASVETGVVGAGSGNFSEVSHTYSAEGTYHVTVLVRDGGGEESLAQWNVSVGPALPPNGPGPLPSAASAPPPYLAYGLLAADLGVAVALALVLGGRARRGRLRPPSGPGGEPLSRVGAPTRPRDPDGATED